MNILILNYEYPPLGGGAGVVSRYHAEGLAKLGHKVVVVTAWIEGEKEEENIGNLKIIKLKSKRKVVHKSNPIEMLSWVSFANKFLSDYCKNEHFDICLTHFTIPGGLVAIKLKKKFKIPYIVISHGEDIPFAHPEKMFKYHIATYLIIKRICKKSKYNVLLSEVTKKQADKLLGKKHANKNIVIPNGSDAKMFKPNYEKRAKVMTILFVGRLTAVKMPYVFLEGFKLLKDKGINFEAIIIGEGELRVGMEKYVQDNNISTNVLFKGWLTKEQIVEEYQKAHIMVMSSRFEAFSIAALEATFSGLYLISTPVSGNTELVEAGVSGDLFGFKSPIELSEKLTKYYNTKYLNNYKLDQRYIEALRETYSWDKIVDNYHNLLIK